MPTHIKNLTNGNRQQANDNPSQQGDSPEHNKREPGGDGRPGELTLHGWCPSPCPKDCFAPERHKLRSDSPA